MEASSCRIFISYAHDSDKHRENVLQYANWLNDPGGLDCWLDQYMEDLDMPEGWPFWMRQQITAAKYVLVVCSPKYLARYEKNSREDGKGLGVKFESTLILNDFYQNESLNYKFIPVFTNPDDAKTIPDILQNQTHYDLSNNNSRDALYRRLTNQPKIVKPKVSRIIKHRTNTIKAEDNTSSSTENIIKIPDLPELAQINDMKPGTKILQAFFALPVIRRFQIAESLGLLQEGESIDSPNLDRLCATFLERAYNRNLMSDLWTRLFDEKIDPNPFKKSIS